jgi:hypothetical protein
MTLRSKLFRGDKRLEACLVHDAAHVKRGSVGDHVARIQTAVSRLNGYVIDFKEILHRAYGASTAAAVLAYKRNRNIVNRAYQTQADDIVGKMTIAQLDREIAQHERQYQVVHLIGSSQHDNYGR